MKLRLCSISFKNKVTIQVNNEVKTASPGQNLDLVELGYIESYGKPHLCGIISKQILNIQRVKENIEELEDMEVSARISWFNRYYPRADLVKIVENQISDHVRGPKKTADTAGAIIHSATDLTWRKNG